MGKHIYKTCLFKSETLYRLEIPLPFARMAGVADIPEEIRDRLENFDAALTEMEEVVCLQFQVPHSKLAEQLTPLERAKLDLANAYALNSIFFQYLATRGTSTAWMRKALKFILIFKPVFIRRAWLELRR